jgi:hypothetical protein
MMEGFTSGKALPDPARKPTAPGTVFPGGRKGGRKAIRPIRAWEQLRWWWSKDKKRMRFVNVPIYRSYLEAITVLALHSFAIQVRDFCLDSPQPSLAGWEER